MTNNGNDKIVFYTFTLGDVEDPDMYAQFEVESWLETELGKWAQKNSEEELTMTYIWDDSNMQCRVSVWGELTEQNHTYWKLKFKP